MKRIRARITKKEMIKPRRRKGEEEIGDIEMETNYEEMMNEYAK